MKREQQNPNHHNQTLDLASSLAIVDQLAGQSQEPAVTGRRREKSGEWAFGAEDLLFDIPEAARGLMAVLPDSPETGSISMDSLEIDLEMPDGGLAAASEMLGGGLIAGSESIGSSLELTSEVLGSGLMAAFEVLGDGLSAFGEGLGGLFEAIGDLDFDFDFDLDFDFF